MSIHVNPTVPPEPVGLDPAVYDAALASAARRSLPTMKLGSACHEGRRAARPGARLSQAVLLNHYRCALVAAIQNGLTIVLAPCACSGGLNTYQALPGIGCLRERARRQALTDTQVPSER